MAETLYIGLMSGTSMDGVDAVAARFAGTEFQGLEACLHQDYPPSLRRQLLNLVRQHEAHTAQQWCGLDAEVGDFFAQAALALLKKLGDRRVEVAAIGSHGQTVFHDATSTPRLTLQLGDPNRIAAATGTTVVADFRRRDLALGGQGAPLVPAFHHALLANADESRGVLNLGGIANITLLQGADAHAVRGFDTGPGNGLLDEWAAQHLNVAFDAGGAFAASGKVLPELLAALLADSYFERPPPKSCGRGDFHLDWAKLCYPGIDQQQPADVQTTFAELTALSVAQAVDRSNIAIQRLIVCGGGVRNGDLMQRLQRNLPSIRVEPSDVYGLDAEWIEASAFAWLAARTLHGLPGNLPAVTGASRPAILGGIYRA